MIGKSTIVFAADMQLFVDALGCSGDISKQIAYTASPTYGGSDFSMGLLFNDARGLDLDVQRPIHRIEITSGWVIDGIK